MFYKQLLEDKRTASQLTKHYTQRIILTRGAIFLSFCLLILYFSIPTDNGIQSKEGEPHKPAPPVPQKPKIITKWTDESLRLNPHKNVTIYVATKWYGMDFPSTIVSSQCSKDITEWCTVVTSPREAHTADAVLFHNRDFNQTLYPKDRNYSQVYVMLSSESPVHEKMDYLPGQINWTMNYRRDADVHYPYVIAKKRGNLEYIDFEEIWSMKNNSLTAAWMVTNCHAANRRKEIAEKARNEGLSLDIFGDCGKPLENCGRYTPDFWGCPTKVMKGYKFYLAFENSNCPDYVTEKLYNACIQYFAVPIVLQRRKYEDMGIPSDSFIAVDDFNTIKELVHFINQLQNDKQRYLEYHRWRETFTLKTTDNTKGFCDLCQKLRSRNKSLQSYSDLPKWYSGDTCDTDALAPYDE